MELQMGYDHKIPVIAIAKTGTKLSSMILGLPNLKIVIFYKNISDLLNKLEKELIENWELKIEN